MNPRRYAAERDFASGTPSAFGMRLNVISRSFELRRYLDDIRDSVDELKQFRRQCDSREFTQDVASDALFSVKRLMRALDMVEFVFPELREEEWFSGFQSDVHHAYWRVEDNRFDGVLDLESEGLDGLCRETADILSNISESPHTNPVDQLARFIEHYGQEIDPFEAPDEYENEVFEARDLYCLGYYSTALIVLGRAVERALLELGEARNIRSVEGHRGSREWGKASFRERADAMSVVDQPDGSGKMISRRQHLLVQLLIDYRNEVAHSEYRRIGKDAASRLIGQSLDLLNGLEGIRTELEEMDDDGIPPVTDVSITG